MDDNPVSGDVPRAGHGQETSDGRTSKGDSFNVAPENEEGGLARTERSESQRSSRYCYYESSS